MFDDVYDNWDDVLSRIEQEHGLDAAMQMSDVMDDSVVHYDLDWKPKEEKVEEMPF